MKAGLTTAFAGVLATGLVAAGLSVMNLPAAVAAPPAADPRVIFEENFEIGLDNTPVKLLDYVGSGGMTYTGSPYWTQSDCNGNLLTASASVADLALTTCATATQFNAVKQISAALGQLPGGPPAATDNHAVTAYTASGTPSGTQFETVDQIPLGGSANRFLTFSVDIGVISCNLAHPRLEYYLKDGGGNLTPLFSTPNDPCDATATLGTARYGTFFGNRAVLVDEPSVGLLFRNLTIANNGNDFAFDNIRLLDATPSLSKSFSSGAQGGGTSTLTFTVTNTTDLAEKAGWSFTDQLPSGMSVAPTPNLASTCAQETVSASAGSTVISVEGSLAAGQESCEVSLDVTAAGGAYANGPDNLTNVVGLDEPADDAEVRFNRPPAVQVSTPTDGATYVVGQQVTHDFTCSDPDGTVASCAGSSPDGAPVDTTTPGSRSFTVTATDDEGATTTTTVTYQVVAAAGACRGTPLSLLGLAPNTANPATTPCATASPKPISTSVTITPAIPLLGIAANQVSVTAIEGASQYAPGKATARAQVAGVTISVLGTTIKATGLTSSASSQLTSCAGPAVLSGLSSIATLTINGAPVANLNQPLTVPLVIGSLGINERVVVGNRITQSALHLNVAGLVDLALGQSVAGAIC